MSDMLIVLVLIAFYLISLGYFARLFYKRGVLRSQFSPHFRAWMNSIDIDPAWTRCVIQFNQGYVHLEGVRADQGNQLPERFHYEYTIPERALAGLKRKVKRAGFRQTDYSSVPVMEHDNIVTRWQYTRR
ncbi:MAG: hypothetical protein JXQ72_12475 [Anaerolineae bacterium]|nr:hypothetical protein [Anaerolineae bacterium]